ncbi:Cytochrome P450 monooxygenase 67 [Mycena sanguinolenta]|uniref:Cytochrome P450 monooxygenase 67 n=1 Tax=Mycena sanguinolenta TaxID=230812 RepID=A0A8H6ZH82_9AGAR|nr:Cytochrome P450 monooxygenase 67 [Mycena sanguinolenta]
MGFEAAAAYIVLVFLISWVYTQWFHPASGNPKRLPFPPGPQPRFLVGNLQDLPTGGREWDGYAALAQKFKSDIIYLRVLGTSILSINSFHVANELLNQRGAVWSDRPRLPMIKELMGWDWNLVVQSYNEGFASHRRIVQQHFQPGVVAEQYRPVMKLEVKVLLQNLLFAPTRFSDHLKRMAGAIIMMVTYGHRVRTDNDPFIQLAEDVRRTSEETPGAALVDTMPILKYLPSCGRLPFLLVKEQLAAGKAVHSMVSSLLENESRPKDGSDEELIKNCGGVVYSAGADTTATALTNFFFGYGFAVFPISKIRGKLPYLSAILKETLRWKAVIPLGVPHCTTEADEYNGWHIPAKTTVLPNISAMLHDPKVYADPEQFNPDRFIAQGTEDAAPDPARATFGFGRRICPGRYFAEDSIWIAISNILHVFSIKGPDGGIKKNDVQWSSGLVSIPSVFSCDIQPRFEGAEQLVREDS